VKELPAVGGFVDPSLEAILGLKPDLVIGVQGPGLHEFPARLESRGIATYFPPTQSFDEIKAMLRALGERLGAEDSAKKLAEKLDAARARVSASLVPLAKPRVLLVFGLRPIVAAGPGGFPDEMLRLAGGVNVVSSERTRFPTLGIERVIALAPDIVLDATGGAMREGVAVTRDLPGWDKVRAVTEGRVVVVNDDRVLRPGPRVGEGLAILAKALHPGVKLP
jgi:iron complex transport system substrate-binding protein